MGKPWFRGWMGFGYVPINWQGWFVLVAMTMTFVPLAALFVMLADSNPATSCVCAGLAAISALVGHTTVVWKLERSYGG